MSNINFAEERLELGIDYGASGGMRFSTTIIETSNGSQQRNANWWLPLGRWQLGDRTLLESQLEQIEEVTYLKEFHAARKGSFEGFRFKDWSDYQIINGVIGIGDEQTTQYQIKKTYYAGAASCTRPITKPVEGTVRVYQGLAEKIAGWSIDYSTGVITFDVPPQNGANIVISCEFDVPVWFEADSIGWRLEGYQDGEAIYKLENVFVTEGRVHIPKPLPIEPLPDLSNQVLDLGIIYDTVETIKYDTSKESLPSGYVRRDSNYDAPITKINLGDRILDREELDKLLGFFWCAKGQAQKFKIQIANYTYFDTVFNNEQMNLKFEGLSDNNSLYLVNSLNFQASHGCVEFIPDFLFDTGNSGWSGFIHARMGNWVEGKATSKWISYQEDTTNIQYLEDFIYDLTYNFVSDYFLQKVKARVAVDNQIVEIKLNGKLQLANHYANWYTWSELYLYQIDKGENTITFTIKNYGTNQSNNPTGLRLEWISACR